MSKKVYVGMSGGVDSSLTAALLKEDGYDVTGVYMKNWAQDLPGFDCPWRDDLADAKRVAVQLGIPFQMYDFQKEYKEKVVDYLIDGYKAGITPNPDVMCNQEVKFKLFLDAALDDGADFIATGHYARVENGQLLTGKDENKDQSYFLYRIDSAALHKTIFPLGELTKPKVRDMASERGLVTANKKDSMGICFVGKVGIREFLEQFVTTGPGPIIDQHGTEIGQHDGALFYTIGQRHGLDVGGGLPYYVTNKDMDTNTVFVTNDVSDEKLWQDTLQLVSCHWINEAPQLGRTYSIRTRHRAPLVEANIDSIDDVRARLRVKDAIRALTPGQSTVIYEDDRVVGGGIVSS